MTHAIVEITTVTLNGDDRIEIAVTKSGEIWIEAIEADGSIISDTTQIVTCPDRIDDLIEALQRAKKLSRGIS